MLRARSRIESDISKLLADIGVMDGFGVDARFRDIARVSLPILHAQRFPVNGGNALRAIVPVCDVPRNLVMSVCAGSLSEKASVFTCSTPRCLARRGVCLQPT